MTDHRDERTGPEPMNDETLMALWDATALRDDRVLAFGYEVARHCATHPIAAKGAEPVYVCYERDIECGTRPTNWCDKCPKRKALAEFVVTHPTQEQSETAPQGAEALEEANHIKEHVREDGLPLWAAEYICERIDLLLALAGIAPTRSDTP